MSTMITWIAALSGVAMVVAITALWSALSAGRSYRADRASLERRIDLLENELSALMDGSCGMGNQLQEMHRDLKGVIERQQQLDQRDLGDLPYNEAMRMVARGAGVDDLVTSCGLSRSEAELVMLLHKSSPPVISPEPPAVEDMPDTSG